jgi:hypothetical protein
MPNVRDDAYAPRSGRDRQDSGSDLPDGTSFFAATEWHDGQFAHGRCDDRADHQTVPAITRRNERKPDAHAGLGRPPDLRAAERDTWQRAHPEPTQQTQIDRAERQLSFPGKQRKQYRIGNIRTDDAGGQHDRI